MKNLKLKGTILKKSLSLFIILSCIMFISNKSYSQNSYSKSGTGTQADPYIIETLAQLQGLATYVNGATANATAGKYFQLDTNIDCQGATLTPIGTATHPFYGTFDGNMHKVMNFSISGNSNIGLFGYLNKAQISGVQYTPTIKQLGVVNATITATGTSPMQIGALVGYIEGCSSVENCFVANATIGGPNATSVGALIGKLNNNTGVTEQIKNCYSQNYTVTGISKVGGLIGECVGAAKLSNCYSTTTVTMSPYNPTQWYDPDHATIQPLIGTQGATITYNNCYYLSNWSGNTTYVGNPFTATTVVGQNSIDASNTTDVDNFKKALATQLGGDNGYVEDVFNINNGYPILKLEKPENITIKTNVTLPCTYEGVLPTDVIIVPVGASLLDNCDLLNGANITIQQKMVVGQWNLWGSTVDISDATTTTANKTIAVLNQNVGYNGTTTNTNVHDMVASQFNYTNNTWDATNSTYLYASDNLATCDAYFVYPLTTSTVASGSNNYSADKYVLVSQTGKSNNYDTRVSTNIGFNFSKTNGGSASESTTGGESGKWFAASNPYTATVKTTDFVDNSSSIQGKTFYIYDAENKKWGTTTSIEKGQGFMVATAKSDGTINFNIKQPTSSSSKAAIEEVSPITFTSKANNTEKDVYANISKVADNSFDINDAYVLLSTNNENLVEPYFVVDNKMILKNEFKTLPYLAPINFHASKTSNVELVANNIPNDIKVSIINLNDNSETELNNKNVFNFVANSGENEGRFVMKFAQNDVSINDEAQSNEIAMSLYPNPASDQTTLTISGINGNAKVLLTDILGQTINSYNIVKGQNSLTIKTNDLNSGIYYVRIINNSISKTEKLIVK
jgi:rRNA processing protein Gar1